MRIHLGLGLAMVLTAACSNTVFNGEGDAGNGGDAGNVPPINGGEDGGTGKVDAVAPPDCDQSKLPTDDVCVVNDAEGVFVSASLGAATGDGSRAKPFASLGAAIAQANKYGMRVYACAETYAESVDFADGTSVFGYFDCKSGWTIDQQSHAKIQSPTSPAATATNITHATRVEAVDVFAPDFTDQSQSSIALIANGSPALTIKNATIHAGAGGKGADGANGIGLTDSGSAKNGGNSKAKVGCSGMLCLGNFGAAGGTNTCSGATGHDGGPGGAGGSGGEFLGDSPGPGIFVWDPVNASPTTGGLATVATTQTAQGGAIANNGSSGSNGADGTDGATGAAIGAISVSGYVSSDGTNGVDGQPGQGGGGAGGVGLSYQNDLDVNPMNYQQKYGWGESGAGGGAGGCPGLAATSGKGGGASIAIIAISSAFTLDTVSIETSVGGDAGAAGIPSQPTFGGSGGVPAKRSGSGGNGGMGGHAGVSGNGGGGASVGIAYQGGALQLLAATIKQGLGGAGVAARVMGNGTTIPASPDGLSKDVYSF